MPEIGLDISTLGRELDTWRVSEWAFHCPTCSALVSLALMVMV